MIYIAMFDEVDEGTAIMKVSQDPPIGPSPFLVFEEGIPSDYYLYLTGYASRVLKGRRESRREGQACADDVWVAACARPRAKAGRRRDARRRRRRQRRRRHGD